MNKLEEYLLIGAIVVFAVLLYLLMPQMMTFIASHSKGSKGLLFLGSIVLVLIVVYYLFGYRKMELLKVALLIVFIAVMVWLYFNYRDLDILISSRYGQGAATIIFLAIILLVWLISKFLI